MSDDEAEQPKPEVIVKEIREALQYWGTRQGLSIADVAVLVNAARAYVDLLVEQGADHE